MMKTGELAADYRNFRFSEINEPQYRHLKWLLFWPVFGLRYLFVENLNPADTYTVIHCSLDDRIPFCEVFLIFYVLWYVTIIGIHLYTLLFDLEAYKSYSKFLLISISISTTIFLVFPNCQELRPETFPRDNILTKLVGMIYRCDTNTNVFPSEHAIGAFGVLAAVIHTKRLRKPKIIAVTVVLTVLVAMSTVFLKQHSVLDVLAAIPVSAIAYWFSFRRRKKYE